MKSVMKEVGIMLLLLVTIILVLVVILYDYNPATKTIPSRSDEVKLNASVKEELNRKVELNTQNIVKTYTIDEQDLASYEKTDEYDKGKMNPFKLSSSNNVSNTDETTGILNTTGK